MAGRRSAAEAQATREAILRRAVDLASVEGLEGLTIGHLASDLGMSKAGILGHFSTKEQLQLAIYHEAARTFRRAVIAPGDGEHGLAQLRGYCARWADFVTDSPWPGGCIITAASFEFDDRPGAVRDAIHEGAVWWEHRLEAAGGEAAERSELRPGADPAQLAFSIVALASGTVRVIRTHRDPKAGARLRRAYEELLDGAAA